MNQKTRRACCIAVILVMRLSTAEGATNGATPQTDTTTFRAALSASFYGFDICGDAGNGGLYRKALLQKVEHCPFTPEAKAEFRRWSATTEIQARADIQRYIAEHDKLPERLDPKKLNCRREHESPAYQKTIVLLGQCAEGAVGFEAVVPDNCDLKAGAP